jgi:hypothetical protein
MNDRGQPHKILIVDDDPASIRMLNELLQERYEVFGSTGGRQVLELVGQLLPDLILLDVIMPEMDGYEICQRLKEYSATRDIPLIFLTSCTETDKIVRGFCLGAVDYITKPFQVAEVLARVETHVQLRAARQEIALKNAELETRAQELEHANEELEAFNYSVAHDLRTPLVTIGLFCNLLLKKHSAALDETGREYLQILLKETTRMDSLVSALLTFSRCSRQEIRKREIDLSRIVNAVRAELLLREPRRQVSFSIAEGVHCYGDPFLMQVVLENLIGNAWKYSSKKESARIEFGVSTTDGETTYFVRDNGAGFEMDKAELLFGAFQRLHDSNDFEGFGIGLTTVQRIIHRHGGRIWAEGEVGKGATFYFSLQDEVGKRTSWPRRDT